MFKQILPIVKLTDKSFYNLYFPS